MPQPIKIAQVADFGGGLNLLADTFQLRGTESPDLMNVDLDPRGGFHLRGVVSPTNSVALNVPPRALWAYSTSAGVHQLVVSQLSDAAYSTGGEFTAINPDALTLPNDGITRMRAVTFNDILWVQRYGVLPPWSWDGTSATVLADPVVGGHWNENIATPTGGYMPLAECITAYSGMVFVANIVENGVRYANRIRWSHPGHAGDWRINDYIDIDIGHDGDAITALISFSDHLVIFKHRSIHILSGYDEDTFSVQPYAQTVGAISQEAVVSTDHGVYFFDGAAGIYVYDGGATPKWLFDRLSPLILDSQINLAAASMVSLGWLNRRLWVSVPYGSGQTTPNRVYVFDPSLGEKGVTGGWTIYDLAVGPMLEWAVPQRAPVPLACYATLGHVLQVEQRGDQDTLTNGISMTKIDVESWYTTRWYDLDAPAVIKRWKRPEFVFDRDYTARLRVDTWRDFDPSNIHRTFYLQVTPLGGSLVWDDGTHATDMLWDSNSWASGATSGAQDIQRGSGLGRGRSIRMRITGPLGPSARWSVNAFTLKYINRRVRN